MSIRKQYDSDLEALRTALVEMGQNAAEAVENALEALCTADTVAAQKIVQGDDRINNMERDIEHRCMTLLLRQQPVASDLRFISAAMKVVTDVERIGDHAADIAEIIPHLVTVRKEGDPAVSQAIAMGRKAYQMILDAMAALTAEDEVAARRVIAADDAVDYDFNAIKHTLAQEIAADPAKLEDPSLIIYNPVLTLGKTHIVTNGDQTDTIFDEMSRGKSFADALRTRTFEPDEPNYTPRISAVVYADGSYQMSILKSADGNGDSVQRYFFDYPQPVAGEGHFISTYKHNGNPIPSFEGEPLRFACPRTIGDFAHDMWNSLNLDNKVSLFARVIDLETGESGDMIFNKYDAVCSDLDDPEEPELLPEELELLKKLDAEEE